MSLARYHWKHILSCFAFFMFAEIAAAQPFVQWERSVDTCSEANAVTAVESGNVIWVGTNRDTTGYINDRICIAEMDPGGRVIWSREIAVPDTLTSIEAAGLVAIPGGGFYVVGTAATGMYATYVHMGLVMRLTSTGEIVWQRYIPVDEFSGAGLSLKTIGLLPDGQVLVAGNTTSIYNANLFKGYVARLDTAGQVLDYILISRGTEAVEMDDLVMRPDGTGVLSGVAYETAHATIYGDGRLIFYVFDPYDLSGSRHELNAYTFSWEIAGEKTQVVSGMNGRLYTVGYHVTYLETPRPIYPHVVELVSSRIDGNIDWSRTFDFDDLTDDTTAGQLTVSAALPTSDGGIVIAGTVWDSLGFDYAYRSIKKGGFIATFDSTGQLVGRRLIGRDDRWEGINDMVATVDQLILVGFQRTCRSVMCSQMYAVSLDRQTATSIERPADRPSIEFTSLYPNPTSDRVSLSFGVDRPGTVTIEVFDLLGRSWQTIERSVLQPGDDRLELYTGQWPSGLYFVRLNSETRTITRPLVVIR